ARSVIKTVQVRHHLCPCQKQHRVVPEPGNTVADKLSHIDAMPAGRVEHHQEERPALGKCFTIIFIPKSIDHPQRWQYSARVPVRYRSALCLLCMQAGEGDQEDHQGSKYFFHQQNEYIEIGVELYRLKCT